MNWINRIFGNKKQEAAKYTPGVYAGFRLFVPVLLAIFTGFLMIHTAAGTNVHSRSVPAPAIKTISDNAELINFAESFLPAPAEGMITRQDKQIIYKLGAAQEGKDIAGVHSGSVPADIKDDYEAVFNDDSVNIWIKRGDAAFGVGMKAVLSPDNAFLGEKNTAVTSQIRNNRIIYNVGNSAMIYTPLDSGVREDIVVASAGELQKLPLLWELGLDSHTQARMEEDGTIGIYGPEQYLWGNIQIGDEKSGKLIEEARKNAPKTELLYKIPLPVIREANGQEHNNIGAFTLDGKLLALKIKG